MKKLLFFVCGLLACINSKGADFETANEAVKISTICGLSIGATGHHLIMRRHGGKLSLSPN